MPPVFLSEDELKKMFFAAMRGEPYDPPNEYAAKVFKFMQRDVADILAIGGTPDIPTGLP